MGTGQYSNRKKGARSKDKSYKRTLKHSRAGKYVDQIQDEIRKVQKEGKPLEFEDDEDLPGLGKFYCHATDKHFMSQLDLDNHMKSRAYKRRLLDLAQKQYTQDEADWGTGKTKEVLPPVGGREAAKAKLGGGAAASSTDWMKA